MSLFHSEVLCVLLAALASPEEGRHGSPHFRKTEGLPPAVVRGKAQVGLGRSWRPLRRKAAAGLLRSPAAVAADGSGCLPLIIRIHPQGLPPAPTCKSGSFSPAQETLPRCHPLGLVLAGHAT